MAGCAHPGGIAALVDAGVWPADSLPWIASSREPYAHWVMLTEVMGVPQGDPRAVAARLDAVADPAVRELIAEIPAWESGTPTADHHSPLFIPNRLGLLASMGVRAGDDAHLDELVETMLSSRDRQGRFVLPEPLSAHPRTEHAPIACDSNAITDVLLGLGHGDDPRVVTAIKRLISDAAPSPQGLGWRCLPGRRPFASLGARRADACPQVTLEGVRVLGRVPCDRRPAWTADAARTLLQFWRRRSAERPYDFGHGYQFKTVKWPSFRYDVLSVLDGVSRFPELWRGAGARAEDRSAIAELAAVLVAHNVDAAGRVVPLRTYRGFERFSFGRRGEPSPFATARLLAALTRLPELAEEVASVHIGHLAPSRPLGPHAAYTVGSPASECPVPPLRVYDSARVLPRVLARHHIGRHWEPASIDSLAGDLVGLIAAHPATPYLSLAARLPAFDPAALDRALDKRRSLVRLRCMRGVLYAVRRDFVPVAHAASARQVVRHARDFASSRGVSAHDYERLARRILVEVAAEPLTTAELRERLQPTVDLAAVVTLMCAEARLVRCAPRDGRFGRRTTFAPFEQVLPEVVLCRMSEDDARATLLRAYVRGFGPVSARDAAWWTGMDLRRVRRAFDALEEELVEITLSGSDTTWLMHAADVEELERTSFANTPAVTLLPALDPLLLSYTDRSRFVDDVIRPFVFDAARNVTSVIIVDGRVAGVWDVTSRPEATALVHLFGATGEETRAGIIAEARRMASLLAGADVSSVGLVESMTPLSERAIGAFRHPLR